MHYIYIFNMYIFSLNVSTSRVKNSKNFHRNEREKDETNI